MARYISNDTGNRSDGTKWDTVTNTPTVHASTNIAFTTTGVYSATFTAPNTTNACTGVAVFIVTLPASKAGNYTVTLQENSIDTAATVVMPASGINSYGRVYFRFATPYVFTSTTAGYYRFKILYSIANTTQISADSGGSNFCYIASDNRTGTAPTSGDYAYVFGQNGATTKTITLDGNVSLGNGGAAPTSRAITRGLIVGHYGKLSVSTTASTTLTMNGSVGVFSDGEYSCGTSAVPLSSSYIHKILFTPTSSGDYGLTAWQGSRCKLYGCDKPFSVSYVSGNGTSTSPLITSGDIGEVGDEVIVTPSVDQTVVNNISLTQYKHIITKNSSTSYVLSQSSGGTDGTCTMTIANPCVVTLVGHGYTAGQRFQFETTGALPTGVTAGTTYYVLGTSLTADTFRFSAVFNSSAVASSGTQSGVHKMRLDTNIVSTNSEVYNIQRNIIGTTNDVTKGMSFYNASISLGDVVFKSVRLSTMYSVLLESGAAVVMNFDYCVFYRALFSDFRMYASAIENTYSYNISCRSSNLARYLGSTSSSIALSNKTFNNRIAIDSVQSGFYYLTIYSTYNNCKAIACGTSSTEGGFTPLGYNSGTSFNNCEAQQCYNAIYLYGGGDVGTFNNCLFNTKGKTSYSVSGDIKTTISAINVLGLFNNCTFGNYGTSLFFNGSYLVFVSGSKLRFHKINGIDNKHEVYTEKGIMYSTGAGLTDTNVRTTGTFNLKLAPENLAIGLQRSFKILARANSAVQVLGFIQKNANMSSSEVTINLYLPGSTTPDATQTMSNNTNRNPFSLFANYSGSVPAYATVTITGYSATAGAAVYIADIFNGTNDIINLKTWDKALPSEIMFEQLGDGQSVWNVLVASQTTTGTMGKFVKGLLTVAKFLGLK